MSEKTENRKTEHLEIALNKKISFKEKTTGFEDIELEYLTLPEIDFEKIETKTRFLGHWLESPFMITAITGGVEKSKQINEDIAKACQEKRIAMGLGSIRTMLEKKEFKKHNFRKTAPDILLFGNIGVAQLKEFSVGEIEKALEELQCNALAIHLNAAQEALQKEGSKNFENCLKEIENTCNELNKLVIVKEVGHGISLSIAEKLAEIKGLKGIDVAGAGGTSWTAIDALRGNEEIAETFWDFGIPTAVSIIQTRMAFEGALIASGGIRNGLNAVKAMVVGADLAGFALPALKAQASKGSKGVSELIERMTKEFKIGMFLCGAKKPEELKGKKYYLFGKTREWVEQ